MDIIRAKEILAALADGVNPVTGEILPEGDSCNQIEIVRALMTVLHELEQRQRPVHRSLPQNNGKPWSKEDDNLLCEMFDVGHTQRKMSEYFKRTRGAISARLERLGKISTGGIQAARPDVHSTGDDELPF